MAESPDAEGRKREKGREGGRPAREGDERAFPLVFQIHDLKLNVLVRIERHESRLSRRGKREREG